MTTKRKATLDLFTVFREETDTVEINEMNLSSNEENSVSLESSEETVSHVVLAWSIKSEVKKMQKSWFSKDIAFSKLSRQLPLLHNMVKTALPTVKLVTSINIICDAININDIFKDIFSSVHLVLRLTLTSPIMSERTFSALKHLYTYVQSTMTEK